MNYTPKDKVIKEGQVFVFGSNLAGVHGAGAAREALEKFGAVLGIGEGLRGSSYALPTKNERIQTMLLSDVKKHVATFVQFAIDHPELQFFVTRIGCGLAGFTDKQIAPLFKDAPKNCELPDGWEPCLNCGKPTFGRLGGFCTRVCEKDGPRAA